MAIETIKDILELTQRLHIDLANALRHASLDVQHQKLKMLLDYLSQHERELGRVVALTERDAHSAILNTWCAEYFDKYPFAKEKVDSIDFAHMNSVEIMISLLSIHEKVIDLYRYLSERAETPSIEEMLSNLLKLEQHEVMRMMRDAERLDDM